MHQLTADHHEPDFEPRDEAYIAVRQRVALAALVVLGGLHAWASWGYTGVFWGEHGGWLHAVERLAGGEAAYRDLQWTSPPLALWLIGSAARVFGTSLAAVSAVMVAVYAAVLAVFFLLVRRLTREIAIPVTLAALLFATAYACRVGVPLPLGSAHPSGPVGFVFLGLTLLGADSLADRPRSALAAATGAAAACALLSAQEYWLAALILLALTAVRLGPGRPLALLGAGFGAVLAAGAATVALSAGGPALAGIVTGFGELGSVAGLAMPTPERLVVELLALAAFTLMAVASLWLCLVLSDRVAGRWTGIALLVFLSAAAVHVGMSVAIGVRMEGAGPDLVMSPLEQSMWRAVTLGRSLPRAAVSLLDTRFLTHLLPVSLPAVLLAVVAARWRHWSDQRLRTRLAILLVACVANRVRTGFSGTEWYHVLLEMPAYALTLRLLAGAEVRKAGRAVLSGYAILILLGMYAYTSHAHGPLTLRGVYPRLVTPRGPVRWSVAEVEAWRDLQGPLLRADPGGTRPLFALGQAGGWNYFTGRPNPTPVVRSLWQFGAEGAERIVTALGNREPAVLLVVHPFVPALRPVAASALTAWEGVLRPGPYVSIDRPRFASLAARCRPLPAADSSAVIEVRDCAQATR